MMVQSNYIVFLHIITAFATGNADEFCEHETFEAKCSQGQVIQIEQALYGRMRRSRCIGGEHLGCEIDVSAKFDSWCSGRPTCSVDVSDLVQQVPEACDRDYRNFVDVSYTCVDVYYPDIDCIAPTYLKVSRDPILLSSFVTLDKQCGGYKHPFILTTEPGRQINITMLDYSIANIDQNTGHYCTVYATLSENEEVGTETICGGKTPRVSHVIKTLTNQVTVRFVSVDEEEKQPIFLFSVQAVGCATPHLTPETIFTRFGNEADISCQGQEENKHHVTCENGQWLGRMANCTVANTHRVVAATRPSKMQFLKEYSIWTIILVALAVTCSVLITGVLCIRRRSLPRRRDIPAQENTDKEQYWPPPPPEALQTHYDPYKSHDNLNSQSNAYFRTWQLQRPHADNCNIQMEQPPPYLEGDQMEHHTMSRFVDHIYESPKFEHAARTHASRNVSESSSGYFEVDQRMTQSHSLAAIGRPH